MTAFAFDILAAMTGPGSKPGVAASGAQADDAVGGGFGSLLAGLAAQQQDVAAAPAAAVASTLAARVAPSLTAPLIAGTGEVEADLPDAAEADDLSASDVALAGAEALVLPAAIVPEPTVAAPDTVATAGTAPIAVEPPQAPDFTASVRPMPGVVQADKAAADAVAREPAASRAGVEAAALSVIAALPDATETPLPAVASMVPATPADDTTAPAATARATPAAAVAVPVGTPELVSLTARLAAPKSAAPAADARPASEPEVAKAAGLEPELVTPGAADAPPVAAETLVAEAVVAEAVETPAPAAPVPAGRRPARIEAPARGDSVIASDRVATLEPGPKAVSASDVPVDIEAVPAVDVDPATPAGVETATTDDAAPPQSPVAPSATHAAQPVAVADHVAAVRGSPETVARLASDIVRKLDGQNTKFDVQLDPLGLGKVDVSVEINADGRLTAALSFETAQAADALRGRAAELRQALEKAGFDLTDSSLSFDMNNQGGGAERQQAGERFAAWSSRAFQTVQTGLDQADALLAAATYARSPHGGVDIRI